MPSSSHDSQKLAGVRIVSRDFQRPTVSGFGYKPQDLTTPSFASESQDLAAHSAARAFEPRRAEPRPRAPGPLCLGVARPPRPDV
eukprot:1537947-Alexandrium_andersonii.AAC.1